MITMLLARKYKLPTYSVGRFYVNDISFCDSIEDRDRGLTDLMSAEEIKAKKVYGETAIPLGTYIVRLTYSPKFHLRQWAMKYGGLVPELVGVKGFEGIRIHPANTAEELLGCIALGENKVKGKVLNSTRWYKELMDDFLWPAHQRNETMAITIR